MAVEKRINSINIPLRPIFILSLPRSGSTLLQRMMMTSEVVDSIAEPWILLPLIYARRSHGQISEYDHRVSSSAIREFASNLPGGNRDFDELIHDFAIAAYSKACKKKSLYFVDKTPRYYLIIDELERIFPEGVFVFLFRHPLSIVSSILRSWCQNSFLHLHLFEQDIRDGQRLLTDAFSGMDGRPNVFRLNYERIVKDPEETLFQLYDALDLPLDKTGLNGFLRQDIRGSMGDKIGKAAYKEIETRSTDIWKETFNNRFRKHFVIKYLTEIGKTRLSVQGYDNKAILGDVDGLEMVKGCAMRDLAGYMMSKMYRFLGGAIYRARLTTSEYPGKICTYSEFR